MKTLVMFGVLAFVALSLAKSPQSRGCIWIMGRCSRECEVGTHGYANGCGRIVPEATCAEPNPKEEDYEICDYTACYCDEPTVRDTNSGKCVAVEDCTKN